MLTLDDLRPGDTYVAWNQGQTITPHGVEVQPLHLDHTGRFIRYRLASRCGLGETTVARFLEILNAEPRPRLQSLTRFART